LQVSGKFFFCLWVICCQYTGRFFNALLF
jgi:hypothetical protein